MKKVISAILVIATVLALTLTASAHEDTHKHDWDFCSWEEQIELYCDCGSTVLIPLDPFALFCAHDMEEYQIQNFHGEKCAKCGFTVQDRHNWDIIEENSQYSHEAVCVDCGYESTHRLVSYHDDTHHYRTCRKCDYEEIHDLSYSYANRYCHEVACEHCSYTIFEAHTFNEDNICVECELLTGMVTGQNTIFDEDGNALENQYYVLVDGVERMFIVDEYSDEFTLGDLITFVHDEDYFVELVDVISADDIDEESFVVESDEDLEWLWWNDFHAVNYDMSTWNTYNGMITYVDVKVGDEIVIITPENPLQNTIYLIVN